jgi:hypothetical protein
MAEIITCPACRRKLQVPESYCGQTVQCPECAHTFMADPRVQGVQTTAPAAASAGASSETDERWREREDDDEHDDFDLMRPLARRSEIPHRGGVILAVGIMSLVMFVPCALFCGPIAWVMGNADLADIRAGRMDPSGEGMVHAGRVLGMISTILMIASVVSMCGFVGFLMIVSR